MNRGLGDERGSAVVAFVLVAPLVTLMVLGALQVVTVALVRSEVMAVALESARAGAAWDGSGSVAAAQARARLARLVESGVVSRVTVARQSLGDIPTVTVSVEVRPRLVGPLPVPTMTVRARSVGERP